MYMQRHQLSLTMLNLFFDINSHYYFFRDIKWVAFEPHRTFAGSCVWSIFFPRSWSEMMDTLDFFWRYLEGVKLNTILLFIIFKLNPEWSLKIIFFLWNWVLNNLDTVLLKFKMFAKALQMNKATRLELNNIWEQGPLSITFFKI